MKKNTILIGSLIGLVALLFTSCEQEPLKKSNSIVPEKFTVDIPNSISQSGPTKSAHLKSTAEDDLSGADIYTNLNTFIWVGENSAELVEEIILVVHYLTLKFEIDNAQSFTYTSDDDMREKRCAIAESPSYNGVTWDYGVTVTDVQNETNADAGLALQVFWNSAPIEGYAILKPANINLKDSAELEEAMYRVHYSEAATDNYDATMEIEIANLPEDENDEFYMNSLKMFVGKKGDRVDVYGNSSHPDAALFNSEKGFNWAFVASGSENDDIAVAEIGLPPSSITSNSREVLLVDYSIKQTFINLVYTEYLSELSEWGINTKAKFEDAVFNPNNILYPYTSEVRMFFDYVEAPGYFNAQGFVAAGTSPSASYAEYETAISTLSPYTPSVISNLQLSFNY